MTLSLEFNDRKVTTMPAEKIGYARTSTGHQDYGLEAQKEDLAKLGCDKVYFEQLSSVDENRKELDAAIDYCRKGDTLVVTKLDRLARSLEDMLRIQKRLEKKGVHLYIQNFGMDTSTATGRLVLGQLALVAQFEREIMLERQRIGIDKAKAEGKFKGRAPTVRRNTDKILELKAKGMSAEKIAEHLSEEVGPNGKPMKMTARSVYRVLAEQRSA